MLYQLSYFRIYNAVFAFATRTSVLQTENQNFNGAENEARTRDPNLGKVVLYQLSYFRIYFVNLAFSAALTA